MSSYGMSLILMVGRFGKGTTALMGKTAFTFDGKATLAVLLMCFPAKSGYRFD
jgi:hypothetical protein